VRLGQPGDPLHGLAELVTKRFFSQNSKAGVSGILGRWLSRLSGLGSLSLWGRVLLAIGLVSLLWVVAIAPSRTELGCQARGLIVTCRLTQRSLIGIPWQQRSITPVQGAQLNSDRQNEPGYVYRMTLHTLTDTIPLAPYSQDFAAIAGFNTRITTFLTQAKDVKAIESNQARSFRGGIHAPIPLVVGVILGAIALAGLGRFLMWLGA
jgi:hypothetical protein